MSKTIKLEVNQNNLIQNLRYTFSSKISLLKEMLQNSRRAGATKIFVNYDEKTNSIEFIDNGIGIQDLQNLLSISDSGWSKDVLKEENAYGMGWISCLFSCEMVEVESLGQSISFSTESAISFNEIKVIKVPTSDKFSTKVKLVGLSKINEQDDLEKVFKDICEAFPVEVAFNGETVKSPLNVLNGQYDTFKYGHIYMPCFTNNSGDLFYDRNDFEINLTGYLQGFNILNKNRYYGYHSLECYVHLDSKQFVGLMPDRTMLVDQEENSKLVTEEVKCYIRTKLLSLKEVMGDCAWVNRFYGLIKYAGLQDELKATNLIPIEFLSKVIDHTIGCNDDIENGFAKCNWEDFKGYEIKEGCIHIKELQNNNVRLCSLPENDESENYGLEYLMAKNLNLINVSEMAILPDDYKSIKLDKYTITPINLVEEGEFYGSWCNSECTVKFADAFEISLLDEDNNIVSSFTTEESFTELHSVDDKHDDARICFVASKDENVEWLLEQICNYLDENESFDEASWEEDCSNFQIYVDSIKGTDALELVNRILGDVRHQLMNNKALKNCVIEIKINDTLELNVIENKIEADVI